MQATTTFLNKPKQQAKALLLLAHGAGAGSQHPFMLSLAEALAEQQIAVQRFDFYYMQQAIVAGKPRPPESQAKLEAQFLALAEQQPQDLPLFIGGKSMGGRIATHILPHCPAIAGLAFGYPFHPPGKPDKLRIAHFAEQSKNCLIVQGERDAFGDQQQIAGYALPGQVQVKFLADGDHSFKPRKASGFEQSQHIQQAACFAAAFIEEQLCTR